MQILRKWQGRKYKEKWMKQSSLKGKDLPTHVQEGGRCCLSSSGNTNTPGRQPKDCSGGQEASVVNLVRSVVETKKDQN